MTAKKKTPSEVARQVSSTSDFKKKTRGILELPSGLVVKVRNPGGMQTYLVQGRIPNTLMPLVEQGLKAGGVDQSELANVANDPKTLADMMTLVDAIVIDTIIDPDVQPIPEDEDDRDDDLLYIDEVTEQDRMFIFNWVNSGVADLAPFRQK